MLMPKVGLLVGAMMFLYGCVGDPSTYETEPVSLETPKGTVICQLYTPDRVIWDRAINRPDSMSIKEADDLCRAEGERQKGA